MQIKAVVGGLNTDEKTIVANVTAAIRRQLPQVRPYQPQGVPIALVAGGPSLVDTVDELRGLVFSGHKVAAVNGAYQWCIDRNIKPDLAIVLDARPDNAAFLKTPVPKCKYLLASQCAPETFDMVAGRDVWIFHAMSCEEPEEAILDAYYGKERYSPVKGGSTVTIRALGLLRMLGFLRLDVFGFDSCWMGPIHHAYPQYLNDTDRRMSVRVRADGADGRAFDCAPWHIRQWEDFQLWVKELGKAVDLHIHGDGMIAYLVRTGARLHREDIQKSKEKEREAEREGVAI